MSWVTPVAVEEWDRPQRNEDVRREEKKHDEEKLAVECDKLSEEYGISTNRQAFTRPFGTLTKSMEGVSVGEGCRVRGLTSEWFGLLI